MEGAAIAPSSIITAIAMSLVAGFALGALAAYASSGLQWRETVSTPSGSTTRVCAEAAVDTGGSSSVLNIGYTRARYNHPCSTARVMPTGWLSVLVYGYRNGAFCGSSGWHNTAQASATMGIGTSLCSDPSGSQEFWTTQFGRIWQESTGS